MTPHCILLPLRDFYVHCYFLLRCVENDARESIISIYGPYKNVSAIVYDHPQIVVTRNSIIKHLY